MANVKITELTALTAADSAATDVLPIVDVSADATKKLAISDLHRSVPDGTLSAPGIAFQSDLNSGLYRSGTDAIALVTNGAARISIDATGNVTIPNNLTVEGTTTFIDSQTLRIEDKNIELGVVSSPSNTTADGGGITLKGASDKTITWVNSTGAWTFNQPVNMTGGIVCIGGTTITDSNLLNVQGSSASKNIGIVLNDTNTSKIYGIQNTGSNFKVFDYTASQNRFTITSTGAAEFGGQVNANSTSGAFQASRTDGDGNHVFRGGNASGYNCLITAGGAGTFAGNVGIGETAPNTKLVVKDASNGLTDSVGNINVISSDSAAVDKGGSIGLGGFYNGTSNSIPFANLHGKKENGTDNNADGYFAISTRNASAGTVERMRIASNGQILLNTTNSTAIHAARSIVFTLAQSGDIAINHSTDNDPGDVFARFGYNGTQIGSITQNGTTAVAYNTSSDHRLKENVVDIADGITRVKQLQPKRFNFIADPDTTVDGFLAHEAQTVVSEAVTGVHNEVDDDGNAVMQGIDQSKLVPLLTAALQEAIAKIESLETRIAALES